MDDKEFLFQMGMRIRKIRDTKNTTRKNLADLCGIEKASMCRIESRKINTTVLTLKKICEALGVEVFELLKE